MDLGAGGRALIPKNAFGWRILRRSRRGLYSCLFSNFYFLIFYFPVLFVTSWLWNRLASRIETLYNPHMQRMPWSTIALGSLLLISAYSIGGQEVQSPQ